MPNLFETPAAKDWIADALSRHSNGFFGELKPAVIWSNKHGDDGELLVSVDPIELVTKINTNPFILLHGHDLGKPKGQVIESAYFVLEDGIKFVVAILGYYAGGDVLSFSGLDLDTKTLATPPKSLPVLPENTWTSFATDPREINKTWLDLVTFNAPLKIKHIKLSHNAADSVQEFMSLALPYLVIIWNPYITSIASEAGKETYKATREWIRKLIGKMTLLRNPVLNIQTRMEECDVSFIFRSKEVAQNYAAHDELSTASAQALRLVKQLKARGMEAQQLIYEFDNKALRWFPSYAILNDGRILTDNIKLIAIEQLPSQLSLGLTQGEALSPSVRASSEKNDERSGSTPS